MSEEKREISFQELVRILIQHRKWIVSEGNEGKRADLNDVIIDRKKINLRMVFLPKANLCGADLHGGNLMEANLSGAELIQADLHAAHLNHAGLYGACLDGADLHGAIMVNADLHRADLLKADLHGAILYQADVHGARLTAADLHKTDFNRADLHGVRASGADFHGAFFLKADIRRANLNSSDFHGADFSEADLRKSDLMEADLRKAILYMADLRGANLAEADFHGADITAADIREADLRFSNLSDANVNDLRYDRSGRYRGIRAATCYGSDQFKRFAQDQSWLEEFLQTRKTKYQKAWAWFWRESCDYGRSMRRWVILSFLVAVNFGCLFNILGPEAFHVEHLPKPSSVYGLASMIYYSVVTFTTLGFGDIVPKTILAAILVVFEVILGYMMLGALISALSNFLVRRS